MHLFCAKEVCTILVGDCSHMKGREYHDMGYLRGGVQHEVLQYANHEFLIKRVQQSEVGKHVNA